MKYCFRLFGPILLSFIFLFSSQAYAQKSEESPSQPEAKRLTLAEAAMCEAIEEYTPQNQGIVFSTGIGKILCLTLFDPVPQKTVVYHNWYRSDGLITKVKLTLKPPRWSTFSSIQLREADKGPWRVEIADQEGRIHKILRFSITD